MDNQEQNKKFVEFEEWRNEELFKANEKCFYFESMSVYDQPSASALIKKVPKCLIHLTRKMCNCSRSCVNKSFMKSIISGCESFDRVNLWYDDNFHECEFLGKKVIGNELVPVETYNKLLVTIENIKQGIPELCDSSEKFESLLCDIYEYRDSCKGLSSCMNFFFNEFSTKYCKNEDYSIQIEEFERILGRKIHSGKYKAEFKKILSLDKSSKVNIDEEKTECLKKYYLNLSKVNFMIDSDKQLHIIHKRDLQNVIIPNVDDILKEYKAVDSEFNSLETTSSKREIFYSTMSLSLISTLLFFILVFLGYKNNKNGKIVVTAVVMTLSILCISIYSCTS
ncbi:hypothetical protein P3W45_000636 [Vairimorpha bombi]